jgi:ABC-type lipoprotein release transport system permease subunit
LPWSAMAIAVAGTVLLANAIAWWPARRVAQKPVAEALTAE